MSRAFVREDSEDLPVRFDLPPRDSPDFDRAAAWALLEGANRGDSLAAESATGFRWGDPALRSHMELLQEDARRRGDLRFEELAGRFLSATGS
jgi:hypothetical protein